MAETSKNKIYYNDNENSIADVLTDMKKMAESTDEAIEKSKYNDTQIKKDISNMKTEIAAKNNEQDNEILQLQTEKAELEKELKEMQEDYYQTSIRGQASGEYIHVEDSSGARCKIGISGNSEQETREGYNLANYKNSATKSDVNFEIGDIESGKTYTLYLNFQGKLSFNLKYGVNGSNIATSYGITGKYIKTFEASESNVLYMNGFSTTNYNGISEIMLLEGTYTKDNLPVYEAYGVSPSPDYPSEIKTVGSNINLYDKDKKVDNTALDLNNGLSIGFRDRATSDYITVKANTNYIFSENGEELKVNIVEYDENKQFIKGYTGTSFIASSNTKYIRFYFNIVDMEIIKLEEGTIATSYSKYGQGSVKLTKCNKNLFDKSNWESGYVGEDGNNASSTTNFRLTKFIKVKPNTQYTISSNTVMKTLRLHEYNKDKTYIKFTYSTDKEKLTIVTSENTKYLRFSGNYNSPSSYTQSVIDGLGIILEEGNIRTSYEEHQEQSYIMPVQQEMLEDDYFDWDNEEEVHVWGKKILDGTENWAYEKFTYADGEKNNFYLKIDDAMSNGKVYSNAFVQRPTLADNYSMFISARKNLNLRYQEKSSSTEFKAYLKSQYDAGTPVVVYYQLATPKKLKFTNEQKAVVKELNNARTYKNVTNITTDSKAILSLDYAKDLETLLNNTQALAVNNASEGV